MQLDDVKPGIVLYIDAAASVQFLAGSEIVFRVIKVAGQSGYAGWIWLAGYVLNRAGDAVERRDIFVQLSGLRLAAARPELPGDKTRNSGPHHRRPSPGASGG